MAFQGSGKVLLTGTAFVSGQQYVFVARLKVNTSTSPGVNEDTLDTSFGTGGFALVKVSSSESVTGMAVDPNSGRIVISTTDDLVALTASGAPDSSFGSAQTGLVGVNGMTAADVAIQGDSQIVVAGRVTQGSKTIAALERFNADGGADTSFGPAGTGLVTTDVNNAGASEFSSVTIDPQGRIVAAGRAVNSSVSTFETMIARYIGVSNLAKPSINWANPAAITYGTPLSSDQLDASASVPGTFHYSPAPGTVLPAGSDETLTVTFTPNDTTDYATATDSASIAVNKATPTLAVHGASLTYDGNPHPASFTIAGANGDDLTGLVSLTYNGSVAVPVQAGTYAVTATFPGNGNYNPVTETAQVVIAQAIPTITWAHPADIVAGTPLGGTQLDATSIGPGHLHLFAGRGDGPGSGVGPGPHGRLHALRRDRLPVGHRPGLDQRPGTAPRRGDDDRQLLEEGPDLDLRPVQPGDGFRIGGERGQLHGVRRREEEEAHGLYQARRHPECHVQREHAHGDDHPGEAVQGRSCR